MTDRLTPGDHYLLTTFPDGASFERPTKRGTITRAFKRLVMGGYVTPDPREPHNYLLTEKGREARRRRTL